MALGSESVPAVQGGRRAGRTHERRQVAGAVRVGRRQVSDGRLGLPPETIVRVHHVACLERSARKQRGATERPGRHEPLSRVFRQGAVDHGVQSHRDLGREVL